MEKKKKRIFWEEGLDWGWVEYSTAIKVSGKLHQQRSQSEFVGRRHQRRIHWISPSTQCPVPGAFPLPPPWSNTTSLATRKNNNSIGPSGQPFQPKDCPVSQVNWLSLASPAIFLLPSALLFFFSLFPLGNPRKTLPPAPLPFSNLTAMTSVTRSKNKNQIRSNWPLAGDILPGHELVTRESRGYHKAKEQSTQKYNKKINK